jgi:hypothetical protein
VSAPATIARISKLLTDLAKAFADLAAEEPAPQADRAVGLAEAAQRIGCTRAWLERRTNWQRCGGFKDLDGHVKFMLSDIRRHQKTRGTVARDGRGPLTG